MKLKNLGNLAVLLLLPFFTKSNGAFLAPETCDVGYDWEIYHYAAVIHREARGEGRDGMISVLSALRNGAHGYKVGKLDPELVELVAKEMKKPVRHQFRHWIALNLATDKRQIRVALRAIKNGRALRVGGHWFF